VWTGPRFRRHDRPAGRPAALRTSIGIDCSRRELARSIDICDFVSLDEIDPIFFRKAYYLLPEDGAEKPYRLLVQALDETGKVGIAKVVIRKKEHLACLRAYDGTLLLETMYYADEVRKVEPVDPKTELRAAEVKMARSLVENLTEAFQPEKYDDTYRKELLELLRAKAAGKPVPVSEPEETAEVVDLMAALRESVERTQRQTTSKGGTTRKRARPRAAKKAS